MNSKPGQQARRGRMMNRRGEHPKSARYHGHEPSFRLLLRCWLRQQFPGQRQLTSTLEAMAQRSEVQADFDQKEPEGLESLSFSVAKDDDDKVKF